MGTILVTGIAGFIGAWTAKGLLERGDRVIGVDNFSDYYDVGLKRDRLKSLAAEAAVFECDIADRPAIDRVFAEHKIDQVCHLAAQAGVRYSLENPYRYIDSNVRGTLNILEGCRNKGVRSFIYASSSSVYGGNKKIPFSEADNVDKPISLYAATKKSNELMAHSYHHLFQIRCTGLRFFTVYGPWGRPDMALFKFTKAILEGHPINVYNYGRMKRDFTYISDVVSGILTALDRNFDFEIFNLGNSQTVELAFFIECIEKEIGRNAQKNLLPLQPGDIPETFADINHARKKLNFEPRVGIEEGIHNFVKWYQAYSKNLP